MSVLIKGYEMPKDGCKDCVMVKRGNVFDICPFLKREVNGNVERGGKPNGCPIIEFPDRNVGDMIFRQDAIDVTWEKMTYNEPWNVLTEVRSRLKALPSVQPEQTTQTNASNTLNALDCISRQAAIDSLEGEIEVIGKANAEAVLKYTKMVCDKIKALPSAQPNSKAPISYEEQLSLDCNFCRQHECGDTLYESSDWDGGIGFDYVRNIQFCPICGRKLYGEE